MKRFYNSIAILASLLLLSVTSSYAGKKKADNSYVVDEYGYATFSHAGFQFKIKESVINTPEAQIAMQHMRDDLDKIVSIIPEEALKVMRSRPIWMEENNTHNRSAAWYHTSADYPASIGDIPAKGKCLEITNYNKYVSSTAMNQPFMVLHELCHLYHDQALGSFGNQEIQAAYLNAKSRHLYDTYYRRYSLDDLQGTEYKADETNHVYCLNDSFEFFAEMSEAYWGGNDYFPYNYEQLKAFDSTAFALMEKIWGPRKF